MLLLIVRDAPWGFIILRRARNARPYGDCKICHSEPLGEESPFVGVSSDGDPSLRSG